MSCSAGQLNSDELERIVNIIQAPQQFKIPKWFLNRQKDMTDGKDYHVCLNSILALMLLLMLTCPVFDPPQTVSNQVDSKWRDDLERLKKIRNHRGLRHHFGLRVRGQHTKTTGRRGKTVYVLPT